MENIHSVPPRWAETYFRRTSAGAEIDLSIKMPRSEVCAVDIKYGAAPKPAKYYSRTLDDVGAPCKYIVHGGNDEFAVGDEVKAIPLQGLMEMIFSS